MAMGIPCRGADRSHDDHDDSATWLHLPMAPNQHTEYPQVFHHPRRVDCIKIWCLMHQKWEFYLSDSSTRDPYQDLSTNFTLNWLSISLMTLTIAAEQALHVAPYWVGKECNTLNTSVPPHIAADFNYQPDCQHHCSLQADENSMMAHGCTSLPNLNPTKPPTDQALINATQCLNDFLIEYHPRSSHNDSNTTMHTTMHISHCQLTAQNQQPTQNPCSLSDNHDCTLTSWCPRPT